MGMIKSYYEDTLLRVENLKDFMKDIPEDTVICFDQKDNISGCHVFNLIELRDDIFPDKLAINITHEEKKRLKTI